MPVPGVSDLGSAAKKGGASSDGGVGLEDHGFRIYTSFVITGASNPTIFSQFGVSIFNRWPVSIYIRC
ncbi:MAG: hypothetical protein RL695_2474 [Pseudomonadota bacterium]